VNSSAPRSLGLRASVVTIGSFDGVHRGHQAIIHVATQRAQELGIPVVAVTFDRHPQEAIQPEKSPPYLTTLTGRLRLLLERGVHDVLVLRFDREFAMLPPEAFVHSVLHRQLSARHIVVGKDFRFGHRRMGSVEYLQEAGARFGFEVEAVPDVLYRGERISSSRIRQALLNGEVREALAMLGRAYVLEGIVVRGQQLGRKLGYPTVNLSLRAPQLIPQNGIYAGRLLHLRTGNRYTAAISVGVRPTVDGKNRTVEAYLLGFSGSLYGEEVHLAFFHRLRDEQRFDSLHALRAQMDRDVQQVAELMGR
jgi:riboflavin kinase/FMN adenylyltransferase